LEKLNLSKAADIVLNSTEPANYTGSYSTVSKEIANREIAMSQSADRVTIDNINIVSKTTITIEMQMLWLTDKQTHIILLQGQEI
jgi:hypothetical protein